MRVIKLGVLDIPGKYTMLLDNLAEKVPVIDLDLGYRVSVILALCVIFLFPITT